MCFSTGCMIGVVCTLACPFPRRRHSQTGAKQTQSLDVTAPPIADTPDEETSDMPAHNPGVHEDTMVKKARLPQANGFYRGPGRTWPACAYNKVAPVVPCPKCKNEMVMRAAKGGGQFWGCSHYYHTPPCRGTRTLDEVRQMDVRPPSLAPHHAQ